MNTQEQLEAVRKESAAWKELIERRDALEVENTLLSACLKKSERQRDELLASAEELLRNAEYADGQGTVLTADCEALEAAVAKAKS